MKILSAYILKSFLKLFLLSLFCFILTYITIDFMTGGLSLIGRGTPALDIAKFFLYKTPLVITQTMPMSGLIATLFTLGIFSKNNEVTAIKSSGISVYRISVPILAASLIISLSAIIISEYVVPYATEKSLLIWKGGSSGNEQVRILKRDNIWYFGEKDIYKINLLDIENKTLHGVTIFKTGDDFQFIERIDAEKAVWKNGKWDFVNGRERFFSNGDYRLNSFKNKEFKLKDKLSDFTVVAKESGEMNFKELNHQIDKLKKMGLDYKKYMVDLLAKIAFPLINFIFPLIGISFSLKTERNAGVASGVGLCIAIGFAYWIVMALSISLGHVGILPPILSAFGANIIFGLTGILLLLNVRT